MKLVICLALCYLIIATHFADISFSSTSASSTAGGEAHRGGQFEGS